MYACMYACMHVCMYVIPRFESFGQTKGEEWSECSGGHQGVGRFQEVTIEELTEKHRMTVDERKKLPVSCTHCGRQSSQPRYIQRHKCVTTRKKG